MHENYVPLIVLIWAACLSLLRLAEAWGGAALERARGEAGEVRCVGCSYSLEGLPVDADICPECGGVLGPERAVVAREREPKDVLARARSTTVVLVVWIVVSLFVLVPTCPPVGTEHVSVRTVRIGAPVMDGVRVTIERRRAHRAFADEGSLAMKSFDGTRWHEARLAARAHGSGVRPLALDESATLEDVADWVRRVYPEMDPGVRARVEVGVAGYLSPLFTDRDGVERPEMECVRDAVNGLARTRSGGASPLVGWAGRPSLGASKPQHALHALLYAVAYAPLVWLTCTRVPGARRRLEEGRVALRG